MTTEPVVDLCFRLTGSAVPVDHGYSLYASLSRVVPALHQAAWLGIHPLTGLRAGGELKLSPASRLRLSTGSAVGGAWAAGFSCRCGDRTEVVLDCARLLRLRNR